jgi:MFS family permease
MIGTAATGLAVDRTDDHTGARITPGQVPTALRAFWADGLFAAAQDAFILAYLPIMASALGASGAQIGLLSGAHSLGALLALYPGAIASRRAASRRWIVVFYAGVLGRLTLLGSALAVASLDGNTALWAITAMLTARAFLGNFVVPAWTSLAADIIPPGLRARYFASRNFATNLALLAVTPLGGFLLDRWGMPGGYVVALLVAFLLGMCATLAYSRIPEPSPVAAPSARTAGRQIAVLRDRRFQLFVAATFMLHFATMLAGPFMNVYLVEDLGGSNFTVGIMSTASAFAGIIGQLYFGDLMQRRGALWVTRLAMLVMPLLPLAWVFVGNEWWVLVPNIAGGFIWAAFGLANFQLLLDVSTEEDRDDYVAAFHTCIFGALLLAPFVGGLLVDTWGYRVDFIVSGVGRLVAALLFFLVVSTPKERVAMAWRARRRPTLAASR